MNTTLSRFIFLLFSTALIPRGSVLSSLMSSVFVNLMPSELWVLHESLNILNQWLKPVGKQKILVPETEKKTNKSKGGLGGIWFFLAAGMRGLYTWTGWRVLTCRDLVGSINLQDQNLSLDLAKGKGYGWTGRTADAIN